MANMSYCRFRNTYGDLYDCVRALKEEGLNSLSEEERRAADNMYMLCTNFVSHYEEQAFEEIEDDDDEQEFQSMAERH